MAAKKAASKKSAKKTARKPNAAFMKAMQPSPALAKIVGDKPLPRTEVGNSSANHAPSQLPRMVPT